MNERKIVATTFWQILAAHDWDWVVFFLILSALTAFGWSCWYGGVWWVK